MTQPTLFDNKPKRRRFDPPHNHTETSRKAAGRVKESEAAKLRRKIYETIRDADGATDAEIQAALELSGDRERPRRKELQKGGFIKDSGYTRPTPAGREAIVWTITGKAHE